MKGMAKQPENTTKGSSSSSFMPAGKSKKGMGGIGKMGKMEDLKEDKKCKDMKGMPCM